MSSNRHRNFIAIIIAALAPSDPRKGLDAPGAFVGQIREEVDDSDRQDESER
jgi:hypothetical protein